MAFHGPWQSWLESAGMNFLKNVVSKLFDKEEEAILNDCIAFDETGLVFTIFVRSDLPRDRLKFVFQEYLRQKQWYLRHSGAASMTAYQTQPDKRTMQVKIGFTGDKERIVQTAWSSPNPASVYLFRDLMMEFVDLLSSQSMLKLQTKSLPAMTVPIELEDILEEEMKPVELMKPEEAMKALRSTASDVQGLAPEKKALAEHVVFEEDDESGSGLFRVICQLNKDAKVAILLMVLSNVANGLDCTSFTTTKTKTAATVKVTMRNGSIIDLIMNIGLNEEKQRVMMGTYPEAHAAYGRTFWIRFAETLAAQGLLLGQTISPHSIASSSSKDPSTSSSSAPHGFEDELADDSGLEYDSDNYDSSEGSVDSDPE